VDDVALDVLVDHTDRRLVLEVVGEELGGNVVLHDLVLEDPEAGLLDRELRELGRSTDSGAHHGLNDPVDPGLVELAERAGSLHRALDCRIDIRATRVGCHLRTGRRCCGHRELRSDAVLHDPCSRFRARMTMSH